MNHKEGGGRKGRGKKEQGRESREKGGDDEEEEEEGFLGKGGGREKGGPEAGAGAGGGGGAGLTPSTHAKTKFFNFPDCPLKLVPPPNRSLKKVLPATCTCLTQAGASASNTFCHFRCSRGVIWGRCGEALWGAAAESLPEKSITSNLHLPDSGWCECK